MRLSALVLAILPLCITARAAQAQPGGGHSPPAVRQLPPVPAVRWFSDQPRQYVLLETFKYQPRPRAEPIVVPAGFVTDFASIPGPLSSVFGPSVHDLPAVVHDYLYWRQSCTRDQADEIFYQALETFGVSLLRRIAIRAGLTLGGPLAYGENARDRKQSLPRIVPESELAIPVVTWQDYRKDMRRRRVPLDPPDAKAPVYCRST
jgi:hypothetical protein